MDYEIWRWDGENTVLIAKFLNYDDAEFFCDSAWPDDPNVTEYKICRDGNVLRKYK